MREARYHDAGQRARLMQQCRWRPQLLAEIIGLFSTARAADMQGAAPMHSWGCATSVVVRFTTAAAFHPVLILLRKSSCHVL